jgi:para-nitrobenzyl esterase
MVPTRAFVAWVGIASALLASSCGLWRESGTAAAPDESSRRTIASGAVIGTVGRYGGHAWLGVPFAKPPVGNLRWRAPEPPQPWTTTRDALRFASPCAQIASPFGGITDAKAGQPAGAEDCLYLNVWSPAAPGQGGLPVMVWIHGGGNSVGHGGFFDGSNLATTHKLVVITINYRLGPLGWLHHPALADEATTRAERSGNFGTLDQIRALEWVRDNVAAFGGDPAKVTIFGESAGGTNVVALLVSPAARGLFHRAIGQSAGRASFSVEEAENLRDATVPGHANSASELLLTLLVQDGSAPDRAAATVRAVAMNAAETARYLRARTSAELLRAAAVGSRNGLLDFPNLIRDGTVLPRDVAFDLLGTPGRYHRVPIMLGTTRDEVKLFLFFDPDLVRRWFGIVPRMRDPEDYALNAEYSSKIWKAAAADEPAMRLSATQPGSVFVYRFDWDEEPTVLGSDLAAMVGAAHAFEIPFVFGHFELGREGDVMWTRKNEPGRQALSAAMMSYWAQFAYAGDPGRGRAGTLPAWKAWAEPTPFIVFDTPAGGGIRMAGDALTKAKIVASIATDPRLPTQRAKCRRFRELALFSDHFTRAEYPAACASYPIDSFPWPE